MHDQNLHTMWRDASGSQGCSVTRETEALSSLKDAVVDHLKCPQEVSCLFRVNAVRPADVFLPQEQTKLGLLGFSWDLKKSSVVKFYLDEFQLMYVCLGHHCG